MNFFSKGSESSEMLRRGIVEQIGYLNKKAIGEDQVRPVGIVFSLNIQVEDETQGLPFITRNTNESYQLKITYDEERIKYI
jgi:hypothetical protein